MHEPWKHRQLYTCTTCRVPFSTLPYVSNRYGVFCQRNCWEKHLADNGVAGAEPKYPGNNIHRR